MGVKTGISWTDATWNPIRGCSRVSEGCRHCYAESVAHRFSGPGLAYEGLVQLDANGKSTGKWNGQIKFLEEHLLDPLRWKPVKEYRVLNPKGVAKGHSGLAVELTRPRRIFVNSMSDLFHENVTDEMRDRIFAVMALCPQHTFQVLTKRPERMLAYFNRKDRGEMSKLVTNPAAWHVWHAVTAIQAAAKRPIPSRFTWTTFEEVDTVAPWPLSNVWLGVSVENQKAADDRLDYLCELASHGWKTMVSFEPLLSAVDPGPWWLSLGASTWAIVGGESGAGARPMHPDWARSLRDQCKAAGVPYFFKQWGEYKEVPKEEHLPARPRMVRDSDVLLMADGSTVEYDAVGGISEAIPMRRVGKKAAGCLLDGVEHHEFPVVTNASL